GLEARPTSRRNRLRDEPGLAYSTRTGFARSRREPPCRSARESSLSAEGERASNPTSPTGAGGFGSNSVANSNLNGVRSDENNLQVDGVRNLDTLEGTPSFLQT